MSKTSKSIIIAELIVAAANFYEYSQTKYPLCIVLGIAMVALVVYEIYYVRGKNNSLG